jgi:tRNA nucleotidyltransferase (CCA-adding enzyme)
MTNIDANIAALEGGSLLTEREIEVFDLVRLICDEFSPKVVARVAGGWVRDKLIGRFSDDIDIAVENTSGLAFARRLTAHSMQDSSKLVVIRPNPDQSKHLETGRVCLYPDFWIDLCGLRSDSYSDDSRIPEVRYGTPSEDAHRRDFTINALFYNLTTRKVEDFTGGIADLRQRLLRTPLEPSVSFLDDPLRILRAFRFSSTLGFRLHPALIPAAQSVVNDFRRKITRERINVELIKSLEGQSPLDVIDNIALSGLFLPIFDPDESLDLTEHEPLSRVRILLERKLEDRVMILVLGAIYAPLSGQQMRDPERKNRNFPALEIVIARKLRFPVRSAEEVIQILLGAREVAKIETPITRLNLGKWIRKVGPLWSYVHYLIFDEVLFRFCVDDVYPLVKVYNLGSAWEMKPLLNGLELAELHKIKPGRALTVLGEQMIEWQLENPLGTAEDYSAYVNATHFLSK